TASGHPPSGGRPVGITITKGTARSTLGARWAPRVGGSKIRRSGERYQGDQYQPIPPPPTTSLGSASRGSTSSRNPSGGLSGGMAAAGGAPPAPIWRRS